MNGMMTYEEYLKLGRVPNPYLVWIKKGKQQFYYLGVKHSFKIEDTVHVVTKHYWGDFCGAIGEAEPEVLIEGGTRPIEETESLAIEKYGEAGLVAYLAVQKGWKHKTPEPDLVFETNELRKEFSEVEIWSYFFDRRACQWNRLENKPDFWEYVGKSLDKYNERLNWNKTNLEPENLIKSFETLSGIKFNENDYEALNKLSDPTRLETKINEVSRRSSQIRDEFIVQRIFEYWQDGKSIFAVYGKTHVIMQERVLRKLL